MVCVYCDNVDAAKKLREIVTVHPLNEVPPSDYNRLIIFDHCSETDGLEHPQSWPNEYWFKHHPLWKQEPLHTILVEAAKCNEHLVSILLHSRFRWFKLTVCSTGDDDKFSLFFYPNPYADVDDLKDGDAIVSPKGFSNILSLTIEDWPRHSE